MKFKRPLDDIFSQQGKVRVLRHLAHTRSEQHGRAIAAELGMSPTACHQILKSLSAAGVVRHRIVGATHLYQLNEERYVVKEMLLPLFALERKYLQSALEAVAKLVGSRALSVVLFGSVARGEEYDGSDVDVLIVVEDEKAKERAKEAFFGRGADIAACFGHLPIPIFWTRAELVEHFKRGSNLIAEILRDGRLIRGRPLYEISLETRRQTKLQKTA